MLIWTKRGRAIVLVTVGILAALIFLAPLAVVLLASIASVWNSVLPGALTGAHLVDALATDNLASLLVSIQTALLAGAIAVLAGGWAALSIQRLPRSLRRALDALFHLPLAVPSVVIGLGMLMAFSSRPLLLGGTKWIVVIAQTMLVFSFAYNTIAAALVRQDPALTLVAGSLGAHPARVLLRVRLPLLLPAIVGAASLSVAMCMGELGATIMVYPASWRTLPVSIFGLADRGQIFLASADTVVLLITTYGLLSLIGGLGRGAVGSHTRG